MEAGLPSSSTLLSGKDGFVSQVDVASGRCLEKHFDSAMVPQQSFCIGALLLGIFQEYLKAKVKEKEPPALSLCYCNKQGNTHIPLLPQVSCADWSTHTLS